MTEEYGELPDWWETLCPENLDRGLCRQYLRPLAWHDAVDENGGRVPNVRGRARTFAEQYAYIATHLATLWYASREKARLTSGGPEKYRRMSDNSWVYKWPDEFHGPLPADIEHRFNENLRQMPNREELVPAQERWNWSRLTAHSSRYPDTQVREIMALLDARPIETVHYVGWLDDALCQALFAAGRYKLTGLSQFGRYDYAPGYRFDDNLELTFFNRPPWLTGIALYQEGGPSLPDAVIRDGAWSYPDQLDAILKHGRRMLHLILLGNAREVARHPWYRWSEVGEILLGELLPEHMAGWPEDYIAMLKEMDARMRGEH